MRVSQGQMSANTLSDILRQCYTLLEFPCTPLPEVKETLWQLAQQGRRMVLFTKGELLDQQHKLERSGLGRYFEHVEITSDKTEREFRMLCKHIDVQPTDLLMVGNSLKSDIEPALSIGASAVHIPFHITWELEYREKFEHANLVQIGHFAELLDVVK
jgi:putative hydrolase of the HAD superfamily